MPADLQAVSALAHVVRVMDRPACQPQDLLLQGIQAGQSCGRENVAIWSWNTGVDWRDGHGGLIRLRHENTAGGTTCRCGVCLDPYTWRKIIA